MLPHACHAVIVSVLCVCSLSSPSHGPTAKGPDLDKDVMRIFAERGFLALPQRRRRSRSTVNDAAAARNDDQLFEWVLSKYSIETLTRGAVKNYQRLASLPVTGVYDTETARSLAAPRMCDLPDADSTLVVLVRKDGQLDRGYYNMAGPPVPKGRFRDARLVAQSGRFPYLDYTYDLQNDTLVTNFTSVAARAFQQWADKTGIVTFRRNATAPDLYLRGEYKHELYYTFDGEGGVLAHAYVPGNSTVDGEIHFDMAETWVDAAGNNMTAADSWRGIDMESVAAHEIGHAIGLNHIHTHTALMNPYYKWGQTVSPIDVLTLRLLLAGKTTLLPTVPAPTYSPAVVAANDARCNVSLPVDNMFMTDPDGLVHTFKGGYYFRADLTVGKSTYVGQTETLFPEVYAHTKQVNDSIVGITSDGTSIWFWTSKYQLHVYGYVTFTYEAHFDYRRIVSLLDITGNMPKIVNAFHHYANTYLMSNDDMMYKVPDAIVVRYMHNRHATTAISMWSLIPLRFRQCSHIGVMRYGGPTLVGICGGRNEISFFRYNTVLPIMLSGSGAYFPGHVTHNFSYSDLVLDCDSRTNKYRVLPTRPPTTATPQVTYPSVHNNSIPLRPYVFNRRAVNNPHMPMPNHYSAIDYVLPSPDTVRCDPKHKVDAVLYYNGTFYIVKHQIYMWAYDIVSETLVSVDSLRSRLLFQIWYHLSYEITDVVGGFESHNGMFYVFTNTTSYVEAQNMTHKHFRFVYDTDAFNLNQPINAWRATKYKSVFYNTTTNQIHILTDDRTLYKVHHTFLRIPPPTGAHNLTYISQSYNSSKYFVDQLTNTMYGLQPDGDTVYKYSGDLEDVTATITGTYSMKNWLMCAQPAPTTTTTTTAPTTVPTTTTTTTAPTTVPTTTTTTKAPTTVPTTTTTTKAPTTVPTTTTTTKAPAAVPTTTTTTKAPAAVPTTATVGRPKIIRTFANLYDKTTERPPYVPHKWYMPDAETVDSDCGSARLVFEIDCKIHIVTGSRLYTESAEGTVLSHTLPVAFAKPNLITILTFRSEPRYVYVVTSTHVEAYDKTTLTTQAPGYPQLWSTLTNLPVTMEKGFYDFQSDTAILLTTNRVAYVARHTNLGITLTQTTDAPAVFDYYESLVGLSANRAVGGISGNFLYVVNGGLVADIDVVDQLVTTTNHHRKHSPPISLDDVTTCSEPHATSPVGSMLSVTRNDIDVCRELEVTLLVTTETDLLVIDKQKRMLVITQLGKYRHLATRPYTIPQIQEPNIKYGFFMNSDDSLRIITRTHFVVYTRTKLLRMQRVPLTRLGIRFQVQYAVHVAETMYLSDDNDSWFKVTLDCFIVTGPKKCPLEPYVWPHAPLAKDSKIVHLNGQFVTYNERHIIRHNDMSFGVSNQLDVSRSLFPGCAPKTSRQPTQTPESESALIMFETPDTFVVVTNASTMVVYDPKTHAVVSTSGLLDTSVFGKALTAFVVGDRLRVVTSTHIKDYRRGDLRYISSEAFADMGIKNTIRFAHYTMGTLTVTDAALNVYRVFGSLATQMQNVEVSASKHVTFQGVIMSYTDDGKTTLLDGYSVQQGIPSYTFNALDVFTDRNGGRAQYTATEELSKNARRLSKYICSSTSDKVRFVYPTRLLLYVFVDTGVFITRFGYPEDTTFLSAVLAHTILPNPYFLMKRDTIFGMYNVDSHVVAIGSSGIWEMTTVDKGDPVLKARWASLINASTEVTAGFFYEACSCLIVTTADNVFALSASTLEVLASGPARRHAGPMFSSDGRVFSIDGSFLFELQLGGQVTSADKLIAGLAAWTYTNMGPLEEKHLRCSGKRLYVQFPYWQPQPSKVLWGARWYRPPTNDYFGASLSTDVIDRCAVIDSVDTMFSHTYLYVVAQRYMWVYDPYTKELLDDNPVRLQDPQIMQRANHVYYDMQRRAISAVTSEHLHLLDDDFGPKENAFSFKTSHLNSLVYASLYHPETDSLLVLDKNHIWFSMDLKTNTFTRVNGELLDYLPRKIEPGNKIIYLHHLSSLGLYDTQRCLVSDVSSTPTYTETVPLKEWLGCKGAHSNGRAARSLLYWQRGGRAIRSTDTANDTAVAPNVTATVAVIDTTTPMTNISAHTSSAFNVSTEATETTTTADPHNTSPLTNHTTEPTRTPTQATSPVTNHTSEPTTASSQTAALQTNHTSEPTSTAASLQTNHTSEPTSTAASLQTNHTSEPTSTAASLQTNHTSEPTSTAASLQTNHTSEPTSTAAATTQHASPLSTHITELTTTASMPQTDRKETIQVLATEASTAVTQDVLLQDQEENDLVTRQKDVYARALIADRLRRLKQTIVAIEQTIGKRIPSLAQPIRDIDEATWELTSNTQTTSVVDILQKLTGHPVTDIEVSLVQYQTHTMDLVNTAISAVAGTATNWFLSTPLGIALICLLVAICLGICLALYCYCCKAEDNHVMYKNQYMPVHSI